MDISLLKINLVKKILNTENEEVIEYINAIFEFQDSKWLAELPNDIRKSVEKGLEQAERGEGISHQAYFSRFIE